MRQRPLLAASCSRPCCTGHEPCTPSRTSDGRSCAQNLQIAASAGDDETGFAEDKQAYMVVYQRGAAVWQQFAEVVCASPA